MAAKRAKKKNPASKTDAACPPRRKRVTAVDVARCAGVSQTTVSIVLSDRRDINIPEATRDRIKKCAEELGYLPSLLAEGFLRGKSKIVGVLLLSDSFLPLLDCVAGIHMGLASNDYVSIVISSYWEQGYDRRLNVCTEGCRGRDELFDVRRLLRHQVEGVICFSTDPEHSAACLAELARHQVPVVTLGVNYPASGADFVGGDSQMAGETAAEHLMMAGCTSFVTVKSPLLLSITDVLCAGFRARLKTSGFSCREITLDSRKPETLDGQLSGIIRPSMGIFAAGEVTAALVVQTVQARGWRVPEDVAVVGMGHSTVAQYLPITTVNRNTFVAGQKAVELLIQRINGDNGPVRNVLIPPTLEVRQSTMRAAMSSADSDATGSKTSRRPGKGRRRKGDS